MIGLLEHLERFVYRKGKKIAVIAPRMRQRLLEKGVPSDKVEVVPNFVDIGDLSPLPKDNDFSRRHGIQGKICRRLCGQHGPGARAGEFHRFRRFIAGGDGHSFHDDGRRESEGIAQETR